MLEQPVAFATMRAFAEKLGQEFDVGRFAAAVASPGKFKERLKQLRVFYLAQIGPSEVKFRNTQEEIPIFPFLFRRAAAAPC